MEKEKMRFPLNLQYFADDEEKEDEEDETLEDDDFDEDEEESDSENQHEEEDTNKSSKKKQSQEENARQAKIRREKEQRERAEREERIRNEAYEKGKLDSTKTNEFTNKPIRDVYDLKIYELQKKIKENGGNPIEDLPDELAKIEREEAQKRDAASKQKQNEDNKILEDIKAFSAKYKDVDIKELFNDEIFSDYVEGKLGKSSLIEVYENFLKMKSKISSSNARDEENKRDEDDAKKRGSSPGQTGSKKKEPTTYSKMSKEEKINELRKQGLIK